MTKAKTKAEEIKEKFKNIGTGPGLDDKMRIGENIENLSSDNPYIRSVAAEYTGRIAVKYGSELVLLCGALPLLMDCLKSEYPGLIYRAAIAISDIAKGGGTDAILDENIADMLMEMMKSSQYSVHEKDAIAQALGWIYASKLIS
jgi:hypothetical protein